MGISIISIKGCYRKKGNNTNYKDADTTQVSSEIYQATNWSIAKCNERKWHSAESWGFWYGSAYYPHQ